MREQGTGTVDKHGYIVIAKREDGVRVNQYLHRIVWEAAYGGIPKGFDVHHIDEDKLNNSLSNLTLMSHVEHCRMHRLQQLAQ